MKLVVVGGYHSKKVVNVRELVPVSLIEERDTSVRGFSPDTPNQMDTVNIHEYIPQSIKFGFYSKELVVLVPRGQDIPETIEILINSHGES